MKKYLIILFVCLLPFFSEAQTTYYVSSTGSDAANGTSTATPFQTISKVNGLTLVAGDKVLFKRGDTFYGTITVGQSGSAGNPITYGAYGTGANPVITGFTNVSSWTNLGSNIWESSGAVSTLSTCSVVVINGVNTPMGRYPNSVWITNTGISTTSLSSTSLDATTTDWTGAEAVIKEERYVVYRASITSASTNTINFASTGYAGHTGWGFFIQNDARTLDAQNEWYYNPSTKKIRIYSTASPTNVQVASVDNLFYATNKSYIKIDGLQFTGANAGAFYLGNFSNATIQNCSFDYNYRAIDGYQYGGSSASLVIQDNTINHSNSDAINLTSEFAGATINGNIIKNTGMLGMAWNGQSMWGMNVTGNNYTIDSNRVDTTGYNPIGFNGSNCNVSNNIVDYFCYITDDGGGIYTGNPQTNVIISKNIVLNGVGNPSGTTNTEGGARGIYCDDNSSGMTISNNSIANVVSAGIFLHDATTPMTITGNTTFNCGIGLLVDRDNTNAHTTGVYVHGNNFVANNTGARYSNADQMAIWYKTAWSPDDIPSFGDMDSNYYSRPFSNTNYIQWTQYGNTDTYYNLASWQSYSGFDAHSSTTVLTTSSKDSLRFVYNPTKQDSIVSLPYKYMQTDGSVNDGTITLAPYSSVVLIQNGTATVVAAPTISLSGDQNITVDNTNIFSTPVWASGHSGTVAWTKTSGPGTTTITPTGYNASVSGLQTGTYVFRCTANQDDSQTAYAEVTVTVAIPTTQQPFIQFRIPHKFINQ